MNMKNVKSGPWIILLSIILAIVVGTMTGQEMGIFGVTFFSLYELFGTIFINALMLIVIPLVSSSIITGIARIGNDNSFGRLGLKTFAFYISTSLLAVLIGLLFVNLLNPGSGVDISAIQSAGQVDLSKLREQVTSHEQLTFTRLLMKMVPSNIFRAFSNGEMLGLIFFSLLFGYAISKIQSDLSKAVMTFWKGIFETMLYMTHLIMKFLPIGVFCLVAKVFASTGIGSLKPLLYFVLAVLLGLIAFSCVILPILLKVIAKVSPIAHFKAMGPALITAFSTSSTSATLPITMECVEHRAGVSNRICSLVIPLGCSINMSGSALYECVAALFIAQAYGIDLSIMTQFLIVFLALLTSMGTAGIPSGSLVGVIVIMKAMGLPTEGIALIVAVDRLLDMCRTTVNALSDSCCAVLVARTEGESQVLAI